MFGNTIKEKHEKNLHNAMLIGYCIEDMPIRTRNRLLKAAKNAGWEGNAFAERRNCEIMVKSAKQIIANLDKEGVQEGMQELDIFWRRLSGWLSRSKNAL